jgi:hypothetical protein
MAIK